MRKAAAIVAVALALAGCGTSPGSSPAGAWIGTAGSESRSNRISIPVHVLTADYLGGSNGTHAVAWTTAALYLDWAETDETDADAIHAAGINTFFYLDPNREQPGSQMDTNVEAAYAHDCSGKRVTDRYGSVTQYVTNPASDAMRKVFKNYSESVVAHAHFDAFFEDDEGALSAFAPYTPFSAMPCHYTDAGWIAAEKLLNQSSAVPDIINGLSGLHGHAPSLGIGIVAGRGAAGGTFEQCYDSNSQPRMDAWLWATIENTELAVAAEHKLFECMGTDTEAASTAGASRIYAYASFLLTYDPATSLYRSEYATVSGLHIFPEATLVALQPERATPVNVSALKQPGGTYAREYADCYLLGLPVGGCAVVVNPDREHAHPFPFPGYVRTLSLIGNGIVDGGVASVLGPPPPSSIGADQAVIAFH